MTREPKGLCASSDEAAVEIGSYKCCVCELAISVVRLINFMRDCLFDIFPLPLKTVDLVSSLTLELFEFEEFSEKTSFDVYFTIIFLI